MTLIFHVTRHQLIACHSLGRGRLHSAPHQLIPVTAATVPGVAGARPGLGDGGAEAVDAEVNCHLLCLVPDSSTGFSMCSH